MLFLQFMLLYSYRFVVGITFQMNRNYYTQFTSIYFLSSDHPVNNALTDQLLKTVPSSVGALVTAFMWRSEYDRISHVKALFRMLSRAHRNPLFRSFLSRKLDLSQTIKKCLFNSTVDTPLPPQCHPMDEQLLLFPEYQQVLNNEKSGHWKQSLPLCQRIVDSLSQAMGWNSPLTCRIAFKTAETMQLLGQNNEAIQYLTKFQKNISGLNVNEEIRCYQHLSLLSLQNTHPSTFVVNNADKNIINQFNQQQYENALKFAELCVDKCESSRDVDLSLFSNSYSLLGKLLYD